MMMNYFSIFSILYIHSNVHGAKQNKYVTYKNNKFNNDRAQTLAALALTQIVKITIRELLYYSI